MKKISVIVLSALFLTSVSAGIAPAFAKDTKKPDEANVVVVKGKVVSMDAAKGELVIQQADGSQKTFKVTEKELKGLKADEEIRVKMTSGTVTSVKPAKKHPCNDKK